MRARWIAAVLAALCVGLVYLMLSERMGRLSMDLQYDDVSYALDAAQRVDAWRTGAAGGFVRDLIAAPPHSPYSTLAGVVAFAILGEHDVSLYLSNLAILVAAALLVAWITREQPASAFAVGLAFVLASPLAFRSQVEFRPDCAYGLAMAAMAAFLASAAVDGLPRRAWTAGLLLGVSLLVKPTFFPHTVVLALALAAVAGGLRRVKSAGVPGLGARDVAAFLAIGAGIATPYYAVAAKPVFGYFWANTFGSQGDVHTAHLPTYAQLFETFGLLTERLAGSHLDAGAIAAVALAVALSVRGARREALRTAIVAFAGLLSLAIIIAGRQPSLYFLATAAWAFVVAAVLGFGALARTLGGPARATLAVATGALLIPLSWSGWHQARDLWYPGARHGESVNVRVVGAIREDLGRRGLSTSPRPVKVFVDSSGPVNPVTLRWVARLHGMRMTGDEVQFLDELPAVRAIAEACDYLVLVRPDAAPFDGWLPIRLVQEPLWRELPAAAGFEVLMGDRSTPYVVLANRALVRPPAIAAPGR